MSDTVFAADWYKSFLAFRKDPKAFINGRKLTRDDFCMDMLKDLYSDVVSAQCKCHLLLALQEHQSYLIQSDTLLEQIVGSLQNLYLTLQHSGESRLLKSYVIVTMTTLLLMWGSSNVVVNSLCLNVKNMLLEIIFSEPRDHVLRSSACRCLEEIEMFFPGSLKEEIDHLLSAVQGGRLLPVQHYVVLLSTCLKNKTDQLKEINDDAKFEKNVIKATRRYSSPSHSKEMQIHHLIACMLDALPSMNEASVFSVFRNLIHIVEHSHDLLPAVFKPFLSKLITSSDMLHFHLALILLKIFGSDLFSSQDEKNLLQQLLIRIGHPSLSTSHHLLYLDWLKTFISKKEVFSFKIPISSLEVLVPGPFDGPYMQEKKIKLLCLFFQVLHSDVSNSEFLVNCMEGLKKQALMNCQRAVPAFFRCLYSVFTSVESHLTQADVKKMILDIMSSSPKLSPFVLDFLQCVKRDGIEVDSIYSMLVNHVLNLSSKQFAQDIVYFIPMLEEAVVEAPTMSKPQVVLRQLKKVLMEPILQGQETDTWTIGHSILSLCSNFLRFHDVELLYYDLAELLNLLMKNIRNCDCRDRAKQYYAVLTSLPQAQVKELFKKESLEKTSDISLTKIVTGSESTFYSRIIKPDRPVFEFVRLKRSLLSFPVKISLTKDDCNQGVFLQKYIEFVNSETFQPTVKIPFILRHLKDAPAEFSTIYCVVITVQSSPECSEISDIEVPVLKKTNDDSDQGITIDIEFVPKTPNPIVLYFRAYFTCSDGSSYSFHLPSVTLELQDLFSLIPIAVDENILERQLFDELWEELEKNKNKSCKSAFRLKCHDSNLHAFIEQHWKQFVMTSVWNRKYSIGIFLPPCSHLLMKIETLNDAGFASVLVDKTILPFTSLYMDRITVRESRCLE